MTNPEPGSKIYSPKAFKFLKVYLPIHYSQQLQIPQAFRMYFKGVFPFECILLTSSSERTWHVDVKEVDNQIIFDKGWPDFVKDCSLEFKDLLVFSYDGESKFHVTVYDQNHCPKDIMSQENKGALDPPCKIDLDNLSNFVPEHPSFCISLCPSYVGNFMHIPTDFLKQHIVNPSGIATLKYSDKSWSVKLNRVGIQANFSGGWPKFVKDNNLQVGDMCVFELIDRENNVFNVSFKRT